MLHFIYFFLALRNDGTHDVVLPLLITIYIIQDETLKTTFIYIFHIATLNNIQIFPRMLGFSRASEHYWSHPQMRGVRQHSSNTSGSQESTKLTTRRFVNANVYALYVKTSKPAMVSMLKLRRHQWLLRVSLI